MKKASNIPVVSWEKIMSPGLVVPHADLQAAAGSLKLDCDVFRYKAAGNCLWIAVMGGTGTGKSTLFNALVGRPVSATGVERPTTTAPVGYGHRDHKVEENFPLPDLRFERLGNYTADLRKPAREKERESFLYFEHDDSRLSHLVFLDTPDMDSLEPMNRYYAEAMYLLAHGIVFVASQEKYADDVLIRFMERASGEGKPLFVVFNKAEEGQRWEDPVEIFGEIGMVLPPERFFLVPFMNTLERKGEFLRKRLEPFVVNLLDFFAPQQVENLIEEDRRKSRKRIAAGAERLAANIDREGEAARQWLDRLDSLFASSADLLMEEMRARHEQKNLDAIKREVKKIFGAYDLLAKPRAYVTSIIRAPLEMLGLIRPETPEEKKEELLRARDRVDNTPVLSAMERANRMVLETLSPSDRNSPFFRALRDDGVAFSMDDTENRLLKLQADIAEWLEATIMDLERDLPAGKKIGIYSTSVVWGAAILSFETVLGGGITLLEMALNTVLAPFVTRGSADLFAHRELKAIIKEMNDRYHFGIGEIFKEQRDRYARILEERLTPEGVRSELIDLKVAMEKA